MTFGFESFLHFFSARTVFKNASLPNGNRFSIRVRVGIRITVRIRIRVCF